MCYKATDGVGAEGEEGAMGPETTTIQVTPEERDAIDRVRNTN